MGGLHLVYRYHANPRNTNWVMHADIAKKHKKETILDPEWPSGSSGRMTGPWVNTFFCDHVALM